MSEDNTDPLIDIEEEVQKASLAFDEILLVLKKHKLRVQELVTLYGNLGYAIGAAIEKIPEGVEGPTPEELQKSYYEKPTIGVALMLQGVVTSSWSENINKENVQEIKDVTR